MPTPGDSGGFLLSLVTESFAVRALLGSLAAAGLAAVLVGAGIVRTRRARRLAVLAPVLTAAVAGVASVGEVYLPQLWPVAAGAAASGFLLESLGEHRGLVTEHGVDVLVVTYVATVSILFSRRLLGMVAVRRTLRRGVELEPGHPVASEMQRLAGKVGVRTPRVLLVEACPGGSFTTGTARTVVALDPVILARLDPHEREGLLAHELAHVRRRDTALALLVGLGRDVAFFLPPLHVAARWLRREQEEGADELASAHTGRPVALASSILKVWDCSKDRRALAGACGAVPGRVALPSGVLAPGPSVGETVRTITARVERLIARMPAPTRVRQCVEAGLASVALLAGATAAVTMPSWINSHLGDEAALSFVYLAAPPAMPVESPAFATFRALTPTAERVTEASVPPEPSPSTVAARLSSTASATALPAGCPCVESQAQLRQREAALGRTRPARLSWGSADRPAWEVRSLHPDASVRTARPLVMISDTGPQVGVFLVSRADR